MALLGEGGYGRVTLEGKYAVKRCPLFDNDELCGRNLREAVFYGSGQTHENIVQASDICVEDGKTICIKMELCNFDLHRYIYATDLKTRLEVVPEFLKAITSALLLLTDAQLSHNDLKPHNILVKGSEHSTAAVFKLCDFGSSEDLRSNSASSDVMACTYMYMAPEGFENGTSSHAGDIWALGVTLHKLVTRRDLVPPIEGGEDIAYKVQLDKLTVGGQLKLRGKVLKLVPVQIAALWQDMLQKDPSLRPTAQKIHAAVCEDVIEIVEARLPVHDPTPSTKWCASDRQGAVESVDRYCCPFSFVLGVNLVDRMAEVACPTAQVIGACCQLANDIRCCAAQSYLRSKREAILEVLSALGFTLQTNTFDRQIGALGLPVDRKLIKCIVREKCDSTANMLTAYRNRLQYVDLTL